jgi:MYXO-CTERM domain-containing protein
MLTAAAAIFTVIAVFTIKQESDNPIDVPATGTFVCLAVVLVALAAIAGAVGWRRRRRG